MMIEERVIRWISSSSISKILYIFKICFIVDSSHFLQSSKKGIVPLYYVASNASISNAGYANSAVSRSSVHFVQIKTLINDKLMHLHALLNRLTPRGDRYVNFLHNFIEMSVKQVLRMKTIIILRGVILI